MSREQSWRFENRWRIEAVLETRTPMRIGSGYAYQNGEIHPDGDSVEVSAVVLDHEGRPCVPGSTLKGNLRAWLDTRRADTALIETVLGADSREGRSGRGGKAEFWDAEWLQGPSESGLPGWKAHTGTAIEASVAIDRLTRTARDRKLFHRAVVAPGTRFRVVITGANLNEREITLLIAALHGFEDQDDPVLIGAETGSGKGRIAGVPDSLTLQRIDPVDVLAWVTVSASPVPKPTYRTLTPEEQAPLNAAAAGLAGGKGRPLVTLDVGIRIDGPFLVNDPPPRPDPQVPQNERPPDHRPRRDHLGRTLLPAKSVRGVVRARAERIIRTLRGHACRSDDPRDACPAIEDREHLRNLCVACRVFGAPGWSAPLAISDFTLAEERAAASRQEFVAIDRFTGGGAEGLKFNAEASVDPRFTGRMTLDLARGEPWMAGLLALVLRDLCEGDLTFGFGAAKGYGAATGTIDAWRLHGLDTLTTTAALSAVGIDAEGMPKEGVGLTPEVEAAISATVRAFRRIIAGEGA